MKKIIIVFLLLSKMAVSQTEEDVAKSIQDGKFNNIRWGIISYVEDHLYKKVGGGVCYELIVSAILSADSTAKKEDLEKSNNFAGMATVISYEELLPGDFIIMEGGIGKDTINHIAIVYGFKDGDIYIADQNTQKTFEESKVTFYKLDYEYNEKRYGDVKYYYLRYR